MAITKKIENTPILPNFNKDPFLAILEGSYASVLFLQWIYISLQMKEIYKMSILEEIIPILVLKWYFKLGILHPHWLWILLIWAGFFIRRPWFVTCSKFYHQKESSKKNKFHQRELFETSLLTKHFIQNIRYIAYVCYHNTWRII